MLSPNYNNFIQQQTQKPIVFQNSFDSANGSFNGSLLTAANTITFNSPPNSLGSHVTNNNFLGSLSPQMPHQDFTKNLIDMQTNQNCGQDDLDFDLHYNSDVTKKPGGGFKSDVEFLVIDEELGDNDLVSEFERAIKGFEDTSSKHQSIPGNNSKRVLNNPINFKSPKSNDLVDSIRRVNFGDSPTGQSITGASFNSTHSTTPQNSFTIKQPTNRTLMKMQLMKQQTEQIEKKTARTNSCLSSNSNSLGHSNTTTPTQNNQFSLNTIKSCIITGEFDSNNNNINKQHSSAQNINQSTFNEQSNTQQDMPHSLTTLEIIPRSILSPAYQHEIKLDNPTKYHVQQIAKHLQEATITHGLISAKKQQARTKIPVSKSVGNINAVNSDSLASLASSGDIAVLPNNYAIYADNSLLDQFSSQHSLDSQNSNFNPTNLSSPSGSSFSQADFLDEIGDFIPDEFESLLNKKSISSNHLTNLEIQEEINRIEESLNLPKTLPNENSLPNLNSPSSFSQQASSSCPADIARLKQLQGLNLTADEIKMIVKDRHKKDTHNMIERRRRFNINDRIKELGTILPKSCQGEIKQNKGSILKASVDYIKNLKHELNKTKQVEEKFRQMAVLNKKLISRIKELEQKTNQMREESSIVNNEEIIQIKQEPQITLRNLVTTTRSPSTQINFQNNSMSPDFIKYLHKHDHPEHVISNTYLLNAGQQSSYHSPQPNNSFQQMNSRSVLSDAMISDDLLNSNADPLLCNVNNMYNDQLMDAISGM